MANDRNDARMIAAFLFENDLTDSKGGNDLTGVGTPTFNSTYYKEGTKSLDLELSSSQYAYRNDADLDSGFPFKSGTSNTKLSVCGWFRLESAATQTIIGKWNEQTPSKIIRLNTYNYAGYYRFRLAMGTETYYELSPTISNGQWYFYAFTLDADTKISYLYIWDQTASRWYAYSKTWTGTPAVGSAAFAVGAHVDSAGAYVNFFDGCKDEIYVFDEILTEYDFLTLKEQTYPGKKTGILFPQVVVEVLYEETPEGTFVYAGDVTAVITLAGTYAPVHNYIGNITVVVNPVAESYTYQSPNTYVYTGANIPVQVNPAAALYLKVPHYIGNIPVQVNPAAASYQNMVRVYQGNIEVDITPTSLYRIPILGWDTLSGYGCVDFTDLGDPPPYWCIETEGISLAFDNTAAVFNLYAEYDVDLDGGPVVGGECEFEIVDPTYTLHTTLGGVKVSGSCNITVPEIWAYHLGTKGGALVQGSLDITFITPSLIDLITTITTEGGAVIAGSPEYSTVEPVDLITTITLTGGAVVGGYRYPPIEFVDRDASEIYYEFTTRGTVFVGGELGFDTPEAPVYEFSTRRGGAIVGGACVFGFSEPPVTEFDIMGGVFVEGSIVEDVELYETYTLTGQNFQPSIYSNFNFNSYADCGGQILAAREDGIYILEGSNDDGQAIRPGVRMGPTNFGVDNLKGIRAIYPGDCGEGAEVRVEGPTKGQEGFYGLDRGRFSVGHEILDRLLIIEISGFEQLSHLEIITRAKTKGQA